MTTREGGVSYAPWASFNLGDHVGDDLAHVAANRARLRQGLPSEPGWLKQVHSASVVETGAGVPQADASITRQAGTVSVVLTADCLPVLFCDRAGSVVAAAHAGWRGLADGVLEATVAAMKVPPADILAWMGAAIGPQTFEVGDEVRQVFVAQHPQAAAAFVAHASGKWLADIYLLARIRLQGIGVQAIYGGGNCTFTDSERFFSYRRDGVTGRMASLIWLA
ncbi:MAG TPA: peptidoglycan editing factor PgeF [Thiobacillus sp.]|nr:MAG: multi-copper polyphenol oxidoreductase [Hydrogenophilales bacterium 28-61-11]OYZ56557.1 MAG: multi-copper polyphenol oxidoreductase [Hydrogenophilales bacterium 16-61-112]OZA43255.1 MAG: multi-copper polyphenol oxidoreductase [Hydrogenophilales bacterium 17-61-76]HQT71691.1 peptidoglycan editing factor PgeF [Thiobacillus sp.]